MPRQKLNLEKKTLTLRQGDIDYINGKAHELGILPAVYFREILSAHVDNVIKPGLKGEQTND